MPDREKVISEFSECVQRGGWTHCGGCEYKNANVLLTCEPLAKEILAMLKEQETKTGRWIIVEYDTLTCSCCGESYYTGCDSTKEAIANLEKVNVYRYCPYCGSKMEGR